MVPGQLAGTPPHLPEADCGSRHRAAPSPRAPRSSSSVLARAALCSSCAAPPPWQPRTDGIAEKVLEALLGAPALPGVPDPGARLMEAVAEPCPELGLPAPTPRPSGSLATLCTDRATGRRILHVRPEGPSAPCLPLLQPRALLAQVCAARRRKPCGAQAACTSVPTLRTLTVPSPGDWESQRQELAGRPPPPPRPLSSGADGRALPGSSWVVPPSLRAGLCPDPLFL